MEFVVWACRSVHIMSAVVWLGGLIYFNAVLSPVAKHEGLQRHTALLAVQERFLGFVWSTLWPLAVTGMILLAVDPRLSTTTLTSLWTWALVAKLVMFVGMGLFSWQMKQVVVRLRAASAGPEEEFEGWSLSAQKLVRRSITAGIIATLSTAALDLA